MRSETLVSDYIFLVTDKNWNSLKQMEQILIKFCSKQSFILIRDFRIDNKVRNLSYEKRLSIHPI